MASMASCEARRKGALGRADGGGGRGLRAAGSRRTHAAVCDLGGPQLAPPVGALLLEEAERIEAQVAGELALVGFIGSFI